MREVEHAVEELEKSAVDLTSLTANDAPLPSADRAYRNSPEEVLNGRGFVLTGASRQNIGQKPKAAIALLSDCAFISEARCYECGRTPPDTVSGTSETTGLASDDPNTRIYQTRERQTHHTDSCDVVGLLCLRRRKVGWRLPTVVSSTTIFN